MRCSLPPDIEALAAAYDRVGESYDRATNAFHDLILHPFLVSRLMSWHNLSERNALDLGCGSGRFLRVLRDLSFTTCGLDISSEAVRRAVEQGLSVGPGCMTELPFESDTFTLVSAIFSLNYLPPDEQRLALHEMHRVLRPQGMALLVLSHPTLTHPDPTNYFQRAHAVTFDLLGEHFPLYVSDWAEIVNDVVGSGLRLQALHDAQPLCELDRLLTECTDHATREFIRQTDVRPFGITVVATK